jgi:Histidine phosphatase superfamily (branch 1)
VCVGISIAAASTAAPVDTTAKASTPAAADTTAKASARPDSTARATVVVVPTPPDSALVALLRRGNLVLLVRHAATDWAQRDGDVLNYADRATQRNLSAVGRAQADSIQKAVAALGLKIGRVFSSPMFRCRDTAEIAFGRADTTSHLFVKSPASRAVRVEWLSTPLTDGKLFVQVTHQDPYIPLLHFQRDQLREGDALVVEPRGNGAWGLLAQIGPADWTRLAAHFGKARR